MSEAFTRKAKKYDEAFRLQALEHWRTSGKSAEEVAGALGITTFSLYQWRRKYGTLPEGVEGSVASEKGSPRTLESVEAENEMLRRELERIKQQRDILKKTLGIMCDTPNSATNGSRS